jgi:hypothetical protein
MSDRKPNQEYPACAQVARRMLAEVYGCKPGDPIPEGEVLISHAMRLVGRVPGTAISEKAAVALQMVDEIGGLYASVGEPD